MSIAEAPPGVRATLVPQESLFVTRDSGPKVALFEVIIPDFYLICGLNRVKSVLFLDQRFVFLGRLRRRGGRLGLLPVKGRGEDKKGDREETAQWHN